MKKNKILNKFKRILITIMCIITLFFSMPVKSSANSGILESIASFLLIIPDGINMLTNHFIAGEEGFSFNLTDLMIGKGFFPDKASLYNFKVTPYDIFTAGIEVEVNNEKETSNTIKVNGEDVPISGGNQTTNETNEKKIKLPILDANFFRKDTGEENDSADILRPVISNVYMNLRNFVLILMLVILLYIGIRIIISSAVSEQVKYKQYIKDWVVGICLVFLMQYIMSAIMAANQILINAMSKSYKENEYEYCIALQNDGNQNLHIKVNDENKEFYSKKIYGDGMSFVNHGVDDNSQIYYESIYNNKYVNEGDSSAVIGAPSYTNITPNAAIFDKSSSLKDCTLYYRCNMIEYIRTLTTVCSKNTHIYSNNSSLTMTQNDSDENDMESGMFWGYVFMYILITIETVVFLYKYMKRVLWLAFLTMIAPLIALMYPVDKVGDGKAQTFNMWFKEYLFNTLIQPLHLLLYTIFIGVASQLITTNVLYAIIAYAFMLTAEKFFKKMFGFDKASTPGGLGSPAAGMMAMRGLDRLGGWGPHGKGGKGGGKDSTPKVKFAKDKLPSPIGNNVLGKKGSTQGGSTGILAPNSSGGNLFAPSSGGGNALTSTRGSRKNAGNSVGKGSIFGGMLKTLDQRAARRITGGRSYSLGNAFKGHKLDMLKTGVSAAGRSATRLAGGALGAVGGLAIGAVSGAMASALTGEDKFSDAITKGALAGGAVGYSRAGQVADWAGDLYEGGKQYKAAGDVAYGAKLTAEEIFKENPELFAGMSGDEIDNAMEAVEAVGHYSDKSDIVKKFDKIVKQYNPNDSNSAETIAAKIDYENTFGNLKVGKNAEEAQKYIAKEIKESGISESEILKYGNSKMSNEISKIENEKKILKKQVEEETENGTKPLTDTRKAQVQNELEKIEKKKKDKQDEQKKMTLDSAINMMAADELNKYRW